MAPGEGFGMHPHKNMELVSIPLQGYLRHGDNVQNESTITPGEIQVMSTGTVISVSYTHLDGLVVSFNMRQNLSQVTRPLKLLSFNSTSEEANSCLLYTSRCV